MKIFRFETKKRAVGVPGDLPAWQVKITVKEGEVYSIYAEGNHATINNAGYLYKKSWPKGKQKLPEVLKWVYKTFPEAKGKLKLQ